MLNKKSIIITGGTGSFGKKFTEMVIKKYKPKKIVIYSRDEFKQFEMQEKISSTKDVLIRYFIGDVRDVDRLKLAMADMDIVIHTAALKQVPATEYNPFEAVKTNVIGAQNVIDASLQSKISKVIALSTDKAAAPINLYGATKLTSDKLFVSANNYVGHSKTQFSVVRYGNVMGSRGSVIPSFLKDKEKNVLNITDKRMTRFSITLEEGVSFVIKCLDLMWGGEIFVPKIPSYKILDVAKAISPNAKLKFIGIRPGEKLHEEMITLSDSPNTVGFNSYYVILPDHKFLEWNINKFLKKNKKDIGKFCNYGFNYSSENNRNFLTVEKLKKLIINNVFGGKNLV
jgi:UDP-N-acetylglucosamine 4,6-dehydratase (inverting)